MSLIQIKKLISVLNEANHAYYNLADPIMTDAEFDVSYDLLLKLEKETGVVISNSPTQKVGYEVVSKLTKVKHSTPLLSLNKTKEEDELASFIGDKECVLMLKMDGLTGKLDYDNELKLGSTRGNGEIGEDITHTVKVFKNIPLNVNGKLPIIGEAIITFQDFEIINSKLPAEDKYKNPRNLASGSVRQLDSSISANRRVRFIAYGIQNDNSKTKVEQLKKLNDLGFETVPYIIVNKDNFEDAIENLKYVAVEKGYPIDGLVCTYNDLNYSNSLGFTSKYPKHSLAFKFDDELHETKFISVEANTTRTGIISLTGIFEPVEIDGTMVGRASLHNVDIFESLQLGVGDTILVRKANMIIPQVMDNLTRSNTVKLPTQCPVCGGLAEVRTAKEARFLHCTNEACTAKEQGKIVHFVSRNAMNIMGLSEGIIEKLVNLGYVKDISDLYCLDDHKNELMKLGGFGRKSIEKVLDSIQTSREVYFNQFIYGLGISGVGNGTSKILAKNFDELNLPYVTARDLLTLDDIGDVVANSIVNWFKDNKNSELYSKLVDDIGFHFIKDEVKESVISGKNFVVTGSVNVFANRKELQKRIEELGGKIKGSVSKDTNFLLNNDSMSSSSKNKKAKELGVQIITEEEFLNMIK